MLSSIALRRLLLKASPYLIALIGGSGIFFLLLQLKDDRFKDLLTNIAATLIAIPIVFFIYESTKAFSEKKLNKELIDYAKMKIDREMISVLSNLMKIVLGYKNYEISSSSTTDFLSMDFLNLKKRILEREFLGFQLFKDWKKSEKGIEEILQNSFILNVLNNDQRVTLVEFLKSIVSLDLVNTYDHVFIEVTERKNNYKVIDTDNPEYLSPILLLEKVDEKAVIRDFGDFRSKDKNNLLKTYKIKNEYSEAFSQDVSLVIELIKRWLKQSGEEFLYDPRILKRVRRKI